MEKEKTILIILLLFLALAAKTEAQAVTAQGGNITPLNISGQTQTRFWQGVPGRITVIPPFAPTQVNTTGGNINRTNFNITSRCANPISITGFILFSNSSNLIVGLTAGNLTLLDALLVSSRSDNATRTFTQNTTFNIGGAVINNVPTTYTYVNNSAQNSVFREGYLNDAAGNIVIAVAVDLNTQGYNRSFFDFQAILPVFNGTSTLYYTNRALNIVCPAGGGGRGRGGGGSSYRECTLNWTCTAWGPCINSLQTRNCTPVSTCKPVLGTFPSETQTCGWGTEFPTIVGEAEVRDFLRSSPPLLDSPETLTAYIGEWTKLPITMTNPNEKSIENITLALKMPNFQQTALPLHTEPKFYKNFGMITAGPLRQDTKWRQIAEFFRLNPKESKEPRLETLTPMILPQRVAGSIEAKSGIIPIASKQIDIVVETRPFVVMQQREGTRTKVQLLIDNRGGEAKTAGVELNFNKGKSTIFTEAYTLDVPANRIAIFGYEYGPLFDYEYINARYDGHVVEAR
ncbi:hypothetical protein KY329_00100 [Candidatus Woesearchaeota archaeon]|nr:hypothetical protein [Candidatus Woesearchaeota archaeon]